MSVSDILRSVKPGQVLISVITLNRSSRMCLDYHTTEVKIALSFKFSIDFGHVNMCECADVALCQCGNVPRGALTRSALTRCALTRRCIDQAAH